MDSELKLIINHYGLSKQLKKLSEEIYELQEAILLDVNDEESFKKILEERADVEVLLRQLDLYFDIKYNDFTGEMVKKVNRQIERIENENRTQ